MNNRFAVEKTEGKDNLAALMNNLTAVRAVVSAVSGTLGPKGLDCMLVDQNARVLVTNDGVTILKYMDATHPAARMIINIAEAQDEKVGDGTTTATIIAGAILEEAASAAVRGVPVIKIIQGMHWGFAEALKILEKQREFLTDLDDPRLSNIALIAARGRKDIADLVVSAAKKTGREKLMDRGFKLAECILAMEGLESKVYNGVIIGKQAMHRQMPKKMLKTKVLVVDDALEPEDMEAEALATETGFRQYLKLQEGFLANLSQLIDEGVGLVLADRSIFSQAEQLFLDKGVIAVQRVANKELMRAAELCGATAVKKTVFSKPASQLACYLGEVDAVTTDEFNQLINIEKGDKKIVTICLGASTTDVVEEKERIAKDAASAVQAAINEGFVPGGGTSELLIARTLNEQIQQKSGLHVYGVKCLIEALKRPLAQIAANASLNPLEKLEEIWHSSLAAPGLDCDSGQVIDVVKAGILDPLLVKKYALYSAVEVAEAILRINTVIKMKQSETDS